MRYLLGLRLVLVLAIGLLITLADSERVFAAQPTLSPRWHGPQNIIVPRLGRVRLNFPRAVDSVPFVLHRINGVIAGSLEHVKVSYSVATSNETNTTTREILFNARNPRSGLIAYIRIVQNKNGPVEFASVPASLLASRGCGSHVGQAITNNNTAASHSSNNSDSSSHRSSALTRQSSTTIKIAFVADREYSQRFGTGTEQHLVTLLDQVNVIYERDLELSITPVLLAREKMAIRSLKSANSGGLLDGFASLVGSKRYGDANVYHLLTGKDLSDNIIGLADLPGVCAPTRSQRVSLSQRLNPAIDYMTIAHEIGHNLSAEHDTVTQPATLMFPSLPVDSVMFSTRSRNQIASFVAFSDIQSCLNAPLQARNAVALKTTLGSNGETQLVLSLPTGSNSCRVVVTGSTSPDFSKPTTITLTSLDSLALRVFSTVAQRPTRNRRIYLRAKATCGSSTTVAKTSISPSGLKSSLRTTALGNWLKLVMSSLQ